MSVPSKAASVFTALFLIIFGCVFTGVGVMMFFMFEDTGSGIAEAIPTFIATVFTLAGLGIIGGAFYSIPHAAALRERAARYPDQPWMLNNAWATGRIRDGNTVTLIIMAIITVVWCGITAKVLISMLIDGDFAQEKLSLFALVLPVIGLALIGTTLYLFLRYRKYGVSVFEMADMPGVLGGSLGGVILTRTPVRTTDGFRLMLRNVHLWSTGTGKNRKTHRETLWEREQRLPKTLDETDGQRAFPVLFTIPYSCHPTHKVSYNKEYYWELVLSGKAPGINYKATFRVPVFKTEHSSPTVTGELESLPEDERTSLGTDILTIPGLSVRKSLFGGEELSFSSTAGRKVGAVFTLLASLGLLGAAFIVGLGGLSVFMGLVLAAMGVYAGWRALGSLFGSTLIGIHPDRLEVTRKFMGLTTSNRVVLGKELKNIQVISTRASNESNHYTLRLDLDGDERIRLPLRISGQVNAEVLAAHIRKLADM